MITTILGFLAFFVGLTLLGWVLTLIRVKMGFVKRGQQAIEEYFNNVEFALLITGLLILLGFEGWIG